MNMGDEEKQGSPMLALPPPPPPPPLPLALALDMNHPIPPEHNDDLPPPQPVQPLLVAPPSEQNCPRCHSHNTKFCYYNNYSLSQPRYFCKDCRRYWTLGGTLRNVPVGGSSRKAVKMNKSAGASSSSSAAAAAATPVGSPQSGAQVSMRISPPSSPSTYITNDGFFTSLSGMHMAPPSPHPMMSQAQIHHQIAFPRNANPGLAQNQPTNNQFLQMLVNGRESINNMESMFLNRHLHLQQQQQPNMALPTPYQSLPFENPNFWASTENRNNSSNGSGASSSNMIPNQWPSLPGYGPEGSSKKDKKN